MIALGIYRNTAILSNVVDPYAHPDQPNKEASEKRDHKPVPDLFRVQVGLRFGPLQKRNDRTIRVKRNATDGNSTDGTEEQDDQERKIGPNPASSGRKSVASEHRFPTVWKGSQRIGRERAVRNRCV